MKTKFDRYVGRHVRLDLRGDPMYGVTLRWGVLREVRDGKLIVDDYHDAWGFGAYLPPRGCDVHDAVPVSVGEVLRIEVDWRKEHPI